MDSWKAAVTESQKHLVRLVCRQNANTIDAVSQQTKRGIMLVLHPQATASQSDSSLCSMFYGAYEQAYMRHVCRTSMQSPCLVYVLGLH